jgi:hypothetical protein
MKTYLIFLLILTMAMPLRANPLIQKPGVYVSDQKTSELSISATEAKISFNFKHTEKDGRSCGTSGFFDSTVRWAFMLEGERKIWIYRGDGRVVATDLLMNNGPQVSVTSGSIVFQLDIESDRNAIPAELLDFINNKPDPSPAPVTIGVKPAASASSRQP